MFNNLSVSGVFLSNFLVKLNIGGGMRKFFKIRAVVFVFGFCVIWNASAQTMRVVSPSDLSEKNIELHERMLGSDSGYVPDVTLGGDCGSGPGREVLYVNRRNNAQAVVICRSRVESTSDGWVRKRSFLKYPSVAPNETVSLGCSLVNGDGVSHQIEWADVASGYVPSNLRDDSSSALEVLVTNGGEAYLFNAHVRKAINVVYYLGGNVLNADIQPGDMLLFGQKSRRGQLKYSHYVYPYSVGSASCDG
ncbi:hypothetical protein [Burkholderia gladioli]|uniref:hypothetical protein n=1 Tax=Burkholderia gladioli TaxID=28095 RepID=UPI00163F4533|nr:hypothetical protein [Burkholderia gladioli]